MLCFEVYNFHVTYVTVSWVVPQGVSGEGHTTNTLGDKIYIESYQCLICFEIGSISSVNLIK